MAERLSRSAPYQVHELNVHTVNDVFRQIQIAIDELNGLSGPVTIHSQVVFDGGATGISHNDLEDVTANQHHAENHQLRHTNGAVDALKLDDLATPDDNSDLNASAFRHGLLPKLSGSASDFLNGTGIFSVPSGGGTEQKTPAFVDGGDTQEDWETVLAGLAAFGITRNSTRLRAKDDGLIIGGGSITPVYDLFSGGHSAQILSDLGSVSVLTVLKAIDALTISGTLATTTGVGDQRNLNGIYFDLTDADNGAGDHRVRGILGAVRTSATAGTDNHKATAIQGNAEATGSSDADLSGITGQTIAISSTPAGRAWSFLATQASVANKSTGLYFGDLGNSWYRGIDFTNATAFSDAAIQLLTGATSGKIAWASGVSIGSSSSNLLWLGDSSVCSINIGSGNQNLSLNTSKTSGAAFSQTPTQTQPNAGDTNDSAYSAGFTLSANSATNELVVRTFTLSLTNTLTGGGHMQNARLMDLSAVASSGAVIDSLSYVFLNTATRTGTITEVIGLNGLNLLNTDFLLAVPGDTTVPSSTFTGRIKIKDAGGTTRYIPYSNS